jgi:hypothetical protein
LSGGVTVTAAINAAAFVAEQLLLGLVTKWLSEGKNPEAEARRVVRIESGVAQVDAELQALVDAKPSGKTPNTGE